MFDFLRKRKQRGSRRIKTEILISVDFQGERHNGVLKDISRSGIRFAGDYPFRPGDEVQVILDLTALNENSEKQILINEPATIRWVKTDSSISLTAFSYGCEFHSEVEALNAFVSYQASQFDYFEGDKT